MALYSRARARAQVKVLTRAIGPDEYDEAVRRAPAACIPFAMGDTRPGHRLLADFPADARRTVASLGAAPDDAALLRLLADFALTP